MPEISSDLSMVRVTNEKWIQTARYCEPKLLHSIIKPTAVVEIKEEGQIYPTVKEIDNPERIPSYHLKKGDRLCGFWGSSGRVCNAAPLLCGKSPGRPGIFSVEIWRDGKGINRTIGGL